MACVCASALMRLPSECSVDPFRLPSSPKVEVAGFLTWTRPRSFHFPSLGRPSMTLLHKQMMCFGGGT